MDLKKMAAQKAATMVGENTVVGLGAGSTIAHLVTYLKASIDKGMSLQFVTSSFSTFQLLRANGLPVQDVASFTEIDIYFDGCDQFDNDLNALKSGGGIHTEEKLLASMAKVFVLIGDEQKHVAQFDTKYPVVIEVLPQASAYVPYKIIQLYDNVTCTMRLGDKKDGAVVTGNGNYLFDIHFQKWPDLSQVNPVLKSVPGVVETSLFYGIAHKAVIAGEKGIQVIEKENSNIR